MKIQTSGQDSTFRVGGKNSRWQYNEVDNAIADPLCTSESLHSTELKEATENRLGWPISFPTFSAHIKRMLSQLELNRKDTGERGKKSVSYSLTECARKKRKLRIFRPTPIQSAAMQVYTKIFLFSVIDKKTFKVQDLDAFLSELGVPREKLVPDTIRYLEKGRGVFISGLVTLEKQVLPPPWILRSEPSSEDLKSATASMMKPETIGLPSDEKSSSYPTLQAVNVVGLDYDPFALYQVIHKPIDGLVITDTEYDLSCFDSHSIPYKEYEASLPGISIREFILDELKNNNTVLIPEVIEKDFEWMEEIFESLEAVGLINKCAKRIHGEYRYVIADDELSDLILDIRYILGLEHKIFDIEFRYFRNPTDQERERSFMLYGKRAAKDKFKLARIARDRFRVGLMKNYGDEKTISKAIDILANVRDIRRSDLTEGIRKVKIKHRSTIQKYEYLHEVIRIVCPTLLQ